MENKNNQSNQEKKHRAQKVLLVGVIVVLCFLGGCWVVSNSIQQGLEDLSKSESFQNWMQEQKNKHAIEANEQYKDTEIFVHPAEK